MELKEMIVYRAKELDITTGRTHPWTHCEHDPLVRYVDFRQEPEKIESSLVDFHGWEQYEATQRFYGLIRWLNGPESLFDTNDCAFLMQDNCTPDQPYRLQASGRLMLFPSDMGITCRPGFINWMMACFDHYLRQIQPQIPACAVGISKAPSFFQSVNATGYELVLYFWAWGNSNDEAMATLDNVFERIHVAAQYANEDVRQNSIPNGAGQEHSAPARNSVI